MGKMKKSTRKFHQKHLKSEISKRRRFQKHSKPSSQAVATAGSQKAGATFKEDGQKKKKNVEDLEVDELLGGDFLSDENEDSWSEDGHLSDELPSDMDSLDSEDEEGLGGGEESEDEEEEGGKGGENGVANGEVGSEEESSDEDDDVGGDPTVIKENKRMRAEISKHKTELEALKAKDPEFYKYLEQTNPELLGFGDGEEEDEEDEEEEEDQEGEEEEERRKGKEEGKEEEEEEEKPGTSSGPIHVTSSLVSQWCSRAKVQGSFGAMRKLVKAYHVAAHVGDSEEQMSSSLHISSSAVYNKLMLFMLNNADPIFLKMLSLDKKAVVTFDNIKASPRWKKVEPLVKSYLGNTIHLMNQMTESGITSFVLRRLRPSALFLTPYAKLQRRCLKQALALFGGAEHSVRLQAFLLIRHMAMTLPAPSMDRCMTGIYQTFLANSKFMSTASAPHVNFMGACIVELWGLDGGAAYQHTFQAIKRLAVVLRNALSMKTKEGYREIYSWQTINCLELWARVLGSYPKGPLRDLVYPLTQQIITSTRLVPNPRYFPLRLRLVRALIRLSVDVDAYIPVAPLLLDVFTWSELGRTPTGGSGRAPDMQLALRASKSALKTTSFQEEVVLQVMELLATHLASEACSVAFPELCHLPLINLRKFAKNSPVERFRKAAKGLVDAIERNISWVGSARSKVDFSPKHTTQVQTFLQEEKQKGQAPLQQYAKQLQTRAQQRASMRSQEEVKMGKRPDRDDDSDDESDDEEVVKKSKKGKQEDVGKKTKKGQEESEDDEEEEEDGSEEEGEEDEEEEDEEEGSEEEEEKPAKKSKGGKVEDKKERKKDAKKDKDGKKDGKKESKEESKEESKKEAEATEAKPSKKKGKVDVTELAMEIPDVLQDFQLSDDDDGDDGVMDVDDDEDVIEDSD